MKTVEIKGLTVTGVMFRTRSAVEGQTETARIGELCKGLTTPTLNTIATPALSMCISHC
jgi:hypothetical protein